MNKILTFLSSSLLLGGFAMASPSADPVSEEEQAVIEYIKIKGTDKGDSWLKVTVRPAEITEGEISTPLHLAAAAGDADTIAELLEEGSDIHALNEEGRNALMIACLKGHYELADMLIQAGADPNLRDKKGFTLMELLAYWNEVDGLKLLLSKGVAVDSVGLDGFTPLLRACQHGSIDAAKYLVEQGADIRAQNKQFCNALIFAAYAGSVELVAYLTELGLKDDVLAKDGRNAFMTSCYFTHLEVMKFFLEHGANPNICTVNERQLPVISTCISGEGSHSLAAVKLLMEAGADINQSNSRDETPIMYAASRNMVPVVEMLLEAGVNINGVKSGKHPLFSALNWGAKDAIRCLLDHGADVNYKDKYGFTPLHAAIFWGNTEIAAMLLDAGANMNARMMLGDTPLILAAKEGSIPFTQLLLERNADLNITDGFGRTALYYAVSRASFELCELLLERGADPNNLSAGSKSPLQMACTTNDKAVAQLLIKHQVIVGLRDINGYTAADYARKGQFEELALLIDEAEQAQKDSILPRISITPAEMPDYIKALHNACKLGHEKRIAQLLRSGVDIDSCDGERKITSLHLCAQRGLDSLIPFLLRHKADINKADALGNTPLLAALAGKSARIPALLLEAGADTKATNLAGQGVLHLASTNSNTAYLEQFLKDGFDINQQDAEGQSPLMMACAANKAKAVQLLLDRGADMDGRDKKGRNALMTAVLHASPAAMLTLLESGANPDLVDEDGNTALILSQLEAVPDNRNYGGLTSGIHSTRYARCALLLAYGAAIDPTNKAGQNAWDCSKAQQFDECTSLLRSYQSGVSLSSLYNQEELDAVLIASIRNKQFEMAQVYLQNGADINASVGYQGDLPLATAIKVGDDDFFLTLLELGADPKKLTRFEHSSIYLAAQHRELFMMKKLIELGVDVNTATYHGSNALIMAYQSEQGQSYTPNLHAQTIELIKCLLEHGADPDLKPKGKASFREILQQNQDQEIQTLLPS